MKRRDFVRGLTAAGMLTACGTPPWRGADPIGARRAYRLDEGWRFHLGEVAGGERAGVGDGDWGAATVPHSARIEALVTGPAGSPSWQWQGVCWYRRVLQLDREDAGRVVQLRFEGGMNVAEVFLDGQRIGGHQGGWLPFVVDLTGRLAPGREHVLAVRLDNRDDPITGPKPLEQLDFNAYHGLYRPVWLTVRDRLHITDPLLAGQVAGGGVFVTFPHISPELATVRVQVHVRNGDASSRSFRVGVALTSPDGATAVRGMSEPIALDAGADTHVTLELEVRSPRLWSPGSPELYVMQAEIVEGDAVVDEETTRIGIRRIDISEDGFRINGEPLFLRGTNRHQEHPYIGYALSDHAQYRDARRIKDAGFDYVRLSHYAHAPAFMAACDELGLVVMDCIPGWQYFNDDPEFVELQYRNCRDLIRRDRNHPCVILWEVSLNESGMTPEFIERTHAIAHEEYPGDQCFTAGWLHGYDVYLEARQHGGCRQESAEPCMVSEYGDWEYYAMNAGLDQDAWEELTPAESNSRQLRWQGERALLQQATNFQEAHDDNQATAAFGDGLWVMFDYNRGYAPDIESSGVMDIFRLPKFSYHFYRSQRDAAERVAGEEVGPVVFIASHWLPGSATDVRVFSNCEEVALHRNSQLLERKTPDRERTSQRLRHPPLTFAAGPFEAGTLEAVGYIGGREVARHAVRTPGAIDRLVVRLDVAGRARDEAHRDHLFVYAELQDAAGTVVHDAWHNVAFGSVGAGIVIGDRPASTDAGIAGSLLQTEPGAAPVTVYALAIAPGPDGARILSGSAALAGEASPHDIRYTMDGSEPGAASARYEGTVAAGEGLRAALLVNGRIVASLAANEPRYRIPASAPPEQRGPFHR